MRTELCISGQLLPRDATHSAVMNMRLHLDLDLEFWIVSWQGPELRHHTVHTDGMHNTMVRRDWTVGS